jgi:ribosomal-protein-alanine N-acetyltransferase
MILCPAQAFDIPGIMAIEHASFIPQIQEKQSVFEERLRIFPQGFLVLNDSSYETVHRIGTSLTAGYFSSELWNNVPQSDQAFSLGHSASNAHCENGVVLYASSFALLPEYRGLSLGTPFFRSSLEAICSSLPQIQKIVLLVNDEWINAFHIYESLGFKTLRRINKFFPSLHNSEGADGILMACNSSSFRIPETTASNADPRGIIINASNRQGKIR